MQVSRSELILGGQKSGKSRRAELLARDWLAQSPSHHALLIATEWNEFREPDIAKMKKAMKRPVILDGRNLYDPKQVRALGFTYQSIGRP